MCCIVGDVGTQVIQKWEVGIRLNPSFDRGENFSGTTVKFGDLLSANLLLRRPDGTVFVQLDGGLGWLFESVNGTPVLKRLPVQVCCSARIITHVFFFMCYIQPFLAIGTIHPKGLSG